MNLFRDASTDVGVTIAELLVATADSTDALVDGSVGAHRSTPIVLKNGRTFGARLVARKLEPIDGKTSESTVWKLP